MQMYELGSEGRKELGQKARNYALSEFGYQKTIDLWYESLLDLLENWKERHESWDVTTL